MGRCAGACRCQDRVSDACAWSEIADNTVRFFDRQPCLCVCDFAAYAHPWFLARLVVGLETEVFVYDFPKLRLLQRVETFFNPYGVLAMAAASARCIMATLGRQLGHVHVLDITKVGTVVSPALLPAHKHAVASLALSSKGDLLATASEAGTVLRLFDVARRVCLQELRRGLASAQVASIHFNRRSTLLCASSERTLHVFDLKTPNNNTVSATLLSQLGEYIPSLKNVATRSFMTFHPPTSCQAVFGARPGTLMAICDDKSFFRYTFNERGPCLEQTRFHRLLKPDATHIFHLVQDEAQRRQVAAETEVADTSWAPPDVRQELAAAVPSIDARSSPPALRLLVGQQVGHYEQLDGGQLPADGYSTDPVYEDNVTEMEAPLLLSADSLALAFSASIELNVVSPADTDDGGDQVGGDADEAQDHNVLPWSPQAPDEEELRLLDSDPEEEERGLRDDLLQQLVREDFN